MLTLNQIDDECEVEECPEHDVELVEAGEDTSEALEPSEEPLDFVAALVEVSVIGPRRDAIGFWRDDGRKAEVECELPGLVAFIGAVHEQRQACERPDALLVPRFEQGTAFGRIMRLSARQAEGQGRSLIRGNHMNLGVPSASGLADGLRPLFLGAPVPSG